MKAVLFLVAAVALSGCTKTVAEMSFSEREALAKEIEQRCLTQGTSPDTERHRQCLQAEAQREIATRERQARVQDARRANAGPTMCQNFGGTVVCF